MRVYELTSNIVLVGLLTCLLSACSGGRPNITVGEPGFMEERETYSSHGSEISAVGMVRLIVVSDVDVIEYAKNEEANVWFRVHGCESGTELSIWPYVYEVPGKAGDGFRYALLFDYRRVSVSGDDYSLSINQEAVCVQLHVNGMSPFSSYSSDVFEVVFPDPLVRSIKAYDDDNGLIDIQMAEECKDKWCIPDYAM